MYRRRQYFVDKWFQSRFILIYCLFITIWSVLNGAIIYYLISNKLEAAYYSSHLKFVSTGDIVLPILVRINLISAAVIFLLAILTVLLDIRKMENYFVKFKDAAVKVADGNLMTAMPHVAMGDIVDDVEDSFNAMTASVREGVVHIKDCVDILDDEVKRFNSILKEGGSSRGDITAAAQRIKEARTNIQTGISRFKVCG